MVACGGLVYNQQLLRIATRTEIWVKRCVADARKLLQQTYGLRGHPSVAILDANGEVAARYFGPETAEKLREDLTAVLSP